MTLSRTVFSTLPLLAGFALFVSHSSAQDPGLPKKDTSAFDEVNVRKDGRGISKEDLPRVKQAFHAYAKYYADLISNPIVYKAPNDPRFGSNTPSIIPTFDRTSQYGFLRDIDRYILEPIPTSKIVKDSDKADYIRELGIAFDDVLKPLIETHQERIVRINATRLLAEVCRSGAHAHWPTVTSLLSNENTPTEIKHYALQAAANLLATSDMNEYKWRTHAIDDKAVGALVEAVTNCILKPNMIIPGFKPETATQNQLEVINFVRKQAIRALGQVHFVKIPGPDGKPLYPAYTLAQVCVSDPKIVPPPTSAECGEAALGLCNMAPSVKGNPIKEFNPRAAAEAFAAGMVTFSSPRADATDRSLPWRQYGVRITEGFKNWKPLFNPLFDATTPPSSDDNSSVPPIINDLIGRVQTFVLTPIEKVDASGKTDINSNVNIEGMKDFLNQLRESPDRKPLLFTDRPETALYKPAAK